MDVRLWDERYRTRELAKEDFDSVPAKLVMDTANKLRPGKALDLACGTGRNALWLAEHGWIVTAVDGSPIAIEMLRQRAFERTIAVDAIVADLEACQYFIQPAYWDLIAISYYLQRDLLGPAMAGVTPGGLLLAIVHITEPDEEPTRTRLRPGELTRYFPAWKIVHSYEGKPRDSSHHRAVAEIVARRPGAGVPSHLGASGTFEKIQPRVLDEEFDKIYAVEITAGKEFTVSSCVVSERRIAPVAPG